MKFRTVLPIVGVLLGVTTGCNRDPGTQAAATASAPRPVGGVGVVDFDILSKQLGRDARRDEAVEERLSSLNAKLTNLQSTLNRLFEEKKTSYGEAPNDEQQKQLSAMQERMTAQLLEAKRKGENELAAFQQKLIDQFREQAKPMLREVAAARGLSIVVPKNPLLILTVDPSVDITDEVAKKMLAAQTELPEATAESPRRTPSTETSAR